MSDSVVDRTSTGDRRPMSACSGGLAVPAVLRGGPADGREVEALTVRVEVEMAGGLTFYGDSGERDEAGRRVYEWGLAPAASAPRRKDS